MRLLFTILLLSAISFGQDRNGISYQALILNPTGEPLPGKDNDNTPLANTDICLKFYIINSSGNYEYSELQTVKTDVYGMVNLIIGTGQPVGAVTWDAVAWSAEAKSLKVDLDITGACTSFTELSNQQLTSVPFALYSPSSNVPGPKGDPGDPGADGDSAYQVWLDAGNTGAEQDFLDSLKGTDGTPGADGDSAYQVWLDAGNTGTEQEFLDSLKGADGTPGADGDSAYQVWLDAGNIGTEQEFLDSLKGADGDPGEGTEGKSAYDIWIELGNTGSEQDFIDSLKGADGDPGIGGNSNNTSYFSEIQEIETVKTLTSCLTNGNGVSGMIAPPGSGWTTNAALNFSSCWTTPNGSYKGGCESSQQWTPPVNCAIEPKSPLPSVVEHSYDDINSNKIEITPPSGMTDFETLMKVEFFDSNGQLIPSFVEHNFAPEYLGVQSYTRSEYLNSNTTQTISLTTDYQSTSSFNKYIFNLPNNANVLKITYEAIAPTTPPNDFYVLVPPSYNAAGGSVSYKWLHRNLSNYEVMVWR